MSPLDYKPLIAPLVSEPVSAEAGSELDAPDRRDGRIYHIRPELQLAVELALATGRPLLLRGDPGSGKSSLAAFVARNLNYRYYEHVVTSTTRAQDLLWRYDTVRRLSDAQVRGRELSDTDYVEPGVLWWAFDAQSAACRGVDERSKMPATLAQDPNAELNRDRREDAAVVLIDEIDKADPDVPNGLLGPLGTTSFVVHETGVEVRRPTRSDKEVLRDPVSRLLLVVTTNEDRDLPMAFIRRCVVHRLAHPDANRLVDIARLHFANSDPIDDELFETLARHVEKLRREAVKMATRPPSTAEFLDAVRASRALKIEVREMSEAWRILEQTTLGKDFPSADGPGHGPA
jgi:MoxR-like ATPase